MEQSLMDKIISLAKRRGFVYPGSAIYGGLANAWDYGPLGVELKNNIKQLWWSMFVHRRDDMVGLDAAILMNPKVWEASGHVSEFSDPLVECKKCHNRFRADHLGFTDAKGVVVAREGISCPECGKEDWALPQQFNLMLQTYLGPAQEKANVVYLRPETAQAMFVDFKSILQTSRRTLPFGVAQIGKAFRNEITPGNFIFRTREFEQMEIEYFIPAPKDDSEWRKYFDEWLVAMREWITAIGLGEALSKGTIHEFDIPDGERAHYSKRTVDFEYEFPFGQKELYGLAYRTDFDLQNHMKASGENLSYTDPHTNETYVPHVIEPSLGVDRTFLAVLCESFVEDEKRTMLKLPFALAPYKVAVFPLLANKPELVDKAKDVYTDLRALYPVAWDDRGNIGKRYFSQDEIGTPYCVTIDFQTLEDGTFTVRHRDSMTQERMNMTDFKTVLMNQKTL